MRARSLRISLLQVLIDSNPPRPLPSRHDCFLRGKCEKTSKTRKEVTELFKFLKTMNKQAFEAKPQAFFRLPKSSRSLELCRLGISGFGF